MRLLLEVDDIHCGYQGQAVVQGLSMTVAEGELACLLGPSGCGKTTVLRAIAGFEPLTEGEIRLRSQVVSKPGRTMPPERRHLGMVFQDYALFPHMTVAGNIGFGLPRMSMVEKRRRVDELLKVLGLEGLDHRVVHILAIDPVLDQ